MKLLIIILFTFLKFCYNVNSVCQIRLSFQDINGKKILFKSISNERKYFVFYHPISCRECYFKINEFFEKRKKGYYLIVPYTKDRIIPIRGLKSAQYLFDRYLSSNKIGSYSITPSTRSNLFRYFSIYQYPSMMVIDSTGMKFYSYNELFQDTSLVLPY